MKKLLFFSLLAVAFPAFAEPASCTEYHQKMEEILKREGNYSEEAMKLVKEQTATIPDEQQDAYCKASLAGLSGQQPEGAEESNSETGKKF
ncbi:MAG: cell surface protein [Cardiobacteriaceae bacterium]|nr:cell surface protein [Cardiobacteriaceae bacterium]